MYGSFLLAIYSEEGEEFQTISKIGEGMRCLLRPICSWSDPPLTTPN